MKYPFPELLRTTFLLGAISSVLASYSSTAAAECRPERFAKCQGAMLANATWRGADLSGGDFRNANFEGANLEGAQFKGAIYEAPTLNPPAWNGAI